MDDQPQPSTTARNLRHRVPFEHPKSNHLYSLRRHKSAPLQSIFATVLALRNKNPHNLLLTSLQPGRSSSPEDLRRERFGRGFAQRSGLRLGLEDEDEDMPGRLPMHSPGDGHSQLPLLKDERGRASYDSPHGSARPAFAARRSTFRSRSPEQNNTSATRDKYAYSLLFLLISLVSFTVQTETAVYIQHELGWNKAYCML